jgi:hypothetical protein
MIFRELPGLLEEQLNKGLLLHVLEYFTPARVCLVVAVLLTYMEDVLPHGDS